MKKVIWIRNFILTENHSKMEEEAAKITNRRPEVESNPENNSQLDPVIKHKLIQRQLLLLLHAENCTLSSSTENNDMEICESDINNNYNCCNLQYCAAMKNVLIHLKSIEHPTLDVTRSGNKCDFLYCYSSRLILTHWNNCSSKQQKMQEDEVAKECLICGPALKLVFYNNNNNISKIRDRSNLKRKSLSSEESESDSEPEDLTKEKYVDNNNDEENSVHLPINTTTTSGNFNNKVWSGTLKWHKRAKTINNSDEQHQPELQIIPFDVSVYSNHKKFLANNIAIKNHGSAAMKLIPTAILSKCGLLTQNVYTVLFKFDEILLDDGKEDGYYELKEILKAGRYAGYVHFEYDREEQENVQYESGKNSSPIKVLFLQYDPDLNNFIGFIPVNQQAFVDKLCLIVQGEKCKLQEMKRERRNGNGFEGENHDGLV